MTTQASRSAAALIDHILNRFHETHRRELPGLLGLARAVDTQRAAPGIAEQIAAMGQALEQHMFKEEMRLIPMMEQGGSTLIVHLIDDLHAEHLAHRDAIASLEAALAALRLPASAEGELATLRRAADKRFADHAQHIEIEDEVLFPVFSRHRPV